MRLPSPSRCRVLIVLATAVALTAPAQLSIAGTASAASPSYAGPRAAVAAAPTVSAFASSPATVGAIPDSPDSACDSAAAPGIRDVSIPVAGLGNPITNVSVQISMRHSNMGDLAIALISPTGTVVNLVDRPNKTPEVPCGESSGVGNVSAGTDALIGFSDGASTSLNSALAGISENGYVTGGTYFPASRTGVKVPLTAPYAALGAAANGSWTLRFIDYRGTNAGTVSSATLRVTTVPKAESAACKSAQTAFSKVNKAFMKDKRTLKAKQAALKKAKRSGRAKAVKKERKRVARAKARLNASAAGVTAATAVFNQACV